MFSGPFKQSIIKRAEENNLVALRYINLRDFGIGKHKQVDDSPYGGGTGMVLRVDVLHKALLATRDPGLPKDKECVILTSAQGKTFTQAKALELSSYSHLILICGHYEGVDARIKQYIKEEISIGDYILTGGEIPAMVIVDSVLRLNTGVLKKEATQNESFSPHASAMLKIEHDHFTKPPIYLDAAVPEVLLSGNHQKIAKWREEQSSLQTKNKRPDLLSTS